MFIAGTYAFVGWNLIPIIIYYNRKRNYQQEYLEGKHSRPWDSLGSTEEYFAFFGWNLQSKVKKRVDWKNWTIEELELEEGVQPTDLLHELPAEEVARRDFETRQQKLEELRKSIIKERYLLQKMPFNNFVFPSNAIFEI